MNVPFVDLKWQHAQIANALQGRLQKIFENTSFVLGGAVKEFESNFASYLRIKHAIGVASGTDAILIALKALHIKPGDEVITIPTTFIAVASAIRHAGGKPVFVDIDPKTRDFNFELLKKTVTPKTKFIIPVHMYGSPADMDKILEFAGKHNVKVIEDVCQAHGATYRGKKVGTLSDIAAFSFYPGKNLGAYGDGGMIVTNDDELATRVKMLRDHGSVKKYEHELLGYNSRLDSMQAAVLDEKLKFLDKWNKLRQEIAEYFNKNLSDVKQIQTFPTLPGTEAVYHLYIIRLKEGSREKFMSYMKENGVGVGIHYPDPLHLLPPFKDLGYAKGDFPESETFCSSIVSLPMFPGMTKDQAEYVVATVKKYFNE